MASYKTPGVYVEEIPKLPQSVADVPTAIPGFVGYTEFASSESNKSSNNLLNKAVKIGSLMEYEKLFGKGPELKIESTGKLSHQFVTYDSIRLFYDNGGGVCYIVSIGDYNTKEFTAKDFEKGVNALESIDEITLLLAPDAAVCLDAGALAQVQQAALKQCKELKDRFAILDVKDQGEGKIDASVQGFRDKIGTNALEYGAAYFPYIVTTYPQEKLDFSSLLNFIMDKHYKEGDTYKVHGEGGILCSLPERDIASCITFYRAWILEEGKKFLEGKKNSELKSFYSVDNIDYDAVKKIEAGTLDVFTPKLTFNAKTLKACYEGLEGLKRKELDVYISSILSPGEEFPVKDEDKILKGDLFLKREIIDTEIQKLIQNDNNDFLSKYLFAINPIDKQQKKNEETLKPFIPYFERYEREFKSQVSLLPPSGAIAGIYAQNDNYSGVWKAPANMSLAGVKGISHLINNRVQDDMNVHPTGKSINAIRFFSGKGILVWGARTLKGNDNEWRYIPVRRLFNYVEESIQESTEWAVFSPNNQNTWTKIKSQIENFLINIWRAGGLAGATPAEAFYVNVGLNITMDVQDIHEGRLIIEVGMAAVRPAEFIILRFSHKLQES